LVRTGFFFRTTGRVALRRIAAAGFRVAARFAGRRLAVARPLAALARRVAGRAAGLRLSFRAARTAGFVLRARPDAVRRAEPAALPLVAFLRSFFAGFRVFFAAMGVLSRSR
jgi:hypothetical protein